MDPARESERSSAHDELDAILRDADAMRRRAASGDELPDEEVEQRPRLNLVEGARKPPDDAAADAAEVVTRMLPSDVRSLEPRKPAETRTPPPDMRSLEPRKPAETRTPPPEMRSLEPRKPAPSRTPPPDLRRVEPRRSTSSTTASNRHAARIRALPGVDADDVRIEVIDKHLSDPGEMKFKTFQLPTTALLAFMLGVAAIAMWALSPNGAGFLKPAPLPPSYQDASARWAMVLTAERIDRFRQEHQRLPEDLAEIGPLGSELITYERLSDGQYRIQAPGTDRPLTLGPATSREVFAANSIDILRVGPDKAP